MLWWRVLAVGGVSLAAMGGCSGKSSSNDDGGSSGESGASNGGSSGKGGSGASNGGSSGKGASSSGGTSGKGGTSPGGSSGLGGSSGSTTVGCGDLTSASARRIAVMNLRATLREAVSGVGFVEGSQLIGRALEGGNRPGSVEFVESANESIDEWTQELETKVLADGNVESVAGAQVIYRMTGDVYCAPDPDDVAFDPDWAAEMQADCASDLAAHPIWVTVTQVLCDVEEAVQIVVEAGNARIRPGGIIAHPHRIDATLDIAQALSYLREQGNDTEFDADSGGTITGALDTSDPSNRFFEMALSSPLVLGASEDDNHARISVEAGYVGLAADSVAQTATADLSASGIAVTGTLRALIQGVMKRAVAQDVPRTESIVLDVPGALAHCEYERDHIDCTDLALGDTTTTVRNQGTVIVDADLTSSAGRRFGAAFGLDADGSVRVQPDPDVTLELGFNLQAIEDKLETIQPFALDDVVTFRFDGDTPSALLLLNDDGQLSLARRTNGPEVLIESGTFVMSSEWSGQKVLVEAGQCLDYTSNSAVSHEILRGFTGGSCAP